MKKIIVMLLAVVMLVSVFACTKPADKGNGGSEPPATTDPENLYDPEALDLPDKTFGGLSYRISTRQNALEYEVFADETATDIRSNALYERNQLVEDRYDVVIEPVICADTTLRGHVTQIMDEIFAEEDSFDVSMTYAAATGSLVVGGYVINWLNLPYNDFAKAYWINDVNKNLILDDCIYTAVGDMSITTLLNTYAMFYNRTEGDKIKMDDGSTTMTEAVFDAIKSDEWTFDYFNSLVADVYSDIDDVVGKSEDDFYGFTAEALTNLDIWQFAFDIPMIVHDEVDGLKSVFNTEKTAQAVDMLNELYWENNGSNITNHCIQKFAAGNSLFLTTWFQLCFSTLKDMEEHYSILPYPMFDENQDGYMAGAMDNYNCISIPFTCSELEMVSYITEVLNYESRRTLYPVYYSESLQKQYARDPESIEMIDVIMAGRTFDLGTIFTSSMNGISMMIRSAVASKNNDFAKFYAEKEEGVNLGITNIIEQYEINKQVGAE